MRINDAIFTSNLEIRPEIKGFRKLQKMSKIKRGGRAQGGPLEKTTNFMKFAKIATIFKRICKIPKFKPFGHKNSQPL